MRFWLTKNSELPIREQLVRQVMLAILSEDLGAGQKLPSIRAIARRHHVHSNTVSAAYHDLLERGWLELRRGSGLYVRALPTGSEDEALDTLLTDLLRTAGKLGHAPDAVLHRLEQLTLPRDFHHIAIVEPDARMFEILRAELLEHLPVPIEALDTADLANISRPGRIIVALPTRAIAARKLLPRGVPLVTLRLRSVGGSLEMQSRPASDALVAIVSKSPEFRYAARSILLAVGLEPESLCEVDTQADDWQQRTTAASLLIADVVAARGLTGRPVEIFRVIADSCIASLKQLCGQ